MATCGVHKRVRFPTGSLCKLWLHDRFDVRIPAQGSLGAFAKVFDDALAFSRRSQVTTTTIQLQDTTQVCREPWSTCCMSQLHLIQCGGYLKIVSGYDERALCPHPPVDHKSTKFLIWYEEGRQATVLFVLEDKKLQFAQKGVDRHDYDACHSLKLCI